MSYFIKKGGLSLYLYALLYCQLEGEEGDLMRGDLEDLLNAVERKRDQLYEIALCKELTSKEVVTFSCELDKLLNEVYILSKRKQLNYSDIYTK